MPNTRRLAPLALLAAGTFTAVLAGASHANATAAAISAAPAGTVESAITAPGPVTVRGPGAVGAATPAAATSCSMPRRCNTPLPIPGAPSGWRHMRTSMAIGGQVARHRGHDVFVREGEAQWAVAKLAYGVPDRNLEDEDVDVYVLRDCARWGRLGSSRTSGHGSTALMPDGSRSREEGIVSFRIPDAQRLAVGMHRVRFVTRGDHTAADVTIDVISPEARVVVSDMDGTLTEFERANVYWVTGLRRGVAANPGAAEALRTLAQRGYRVFYLTGRPDWTATDTHDWLQANGFPRGVLRTRAGAGIGILGPDVQQFKETEMRALTRVLGRSADYAFGNTPTDVSAYRVGGVDPAHRFFFRLAVDRAGGQLNNDYRVLAANFRQLPLVCPRPGHDADAPQTGNFAKR